MNDSRSKTTPSDRPVGKMAYIKTEKEDAASSNPETMIFDSEGFMARVGGDQAIGRLILNNFLEDVPRQITVLIDAVGQEKTDLSTRQAHSIKGAGAVVGGIVFSRLAERIEKFCRAGEMETVKNNLSELEHEFNRLKTAIKRSAAVQWIQANPDD